MICRLAPADTWGLRQQVLHPERPWPSSANPRDLVPDALHLGWRASGELLAVGSIAREDPGPEGLSNPVPAIFREAAGRAWRLRGMAVVPAAQGRGIGGELLNRLLAHVAACDAGGLVWCHGRESAEGFYGRHGFRRIGHIDVPEKGPRLILARRLP